MSESALVTKHPELVNALYECARDNHICSTRAKEEGIDCWKHCDACAELCKTTAKWIILNDKGMEKSLKRLVDVTIEACQRCVDNCSKHKNPHCKKCSESSAVCVEAAKKFLSQ